MNNKTQYIYNTCTRTHTISAFVYGFRTKDSTELAAVKLVDYIYI